MLVSHETLPLQVKVFHVELPDPWVPHHGVAIPTLARQLNDVMRQPSSSGS